MKLLIFIYSLSSGGAERVTANLANHWATRGWRITIVTLAPQGMDFYELHPAVQRIALELAGESRNPIDAVVNNLKRLRALRRVLREISPHIVVGMMSTANTLLCLSTARLRGIGVIVSERTYPPALPLGRFWERLRSLSYPWADRVTLLTSEGLTWLAREIPNARGVVVPNPLPYPLPVKAPRLLPEDTVDRNRKLLLAVGRLSGEKAFDLLLAAFVKLVRSNPDWDMVILGEGPLRTELVSQVQGLGLTDRVHLPGRAGNVGDWYSRADLYVMSSRFEGFPNTLGEAMAHGCAAVSYDCDTGPRDLIRHGVDGLLVKPVGDVSALAKSLAQLMQDDALRARMAAKATEVRERYSIERILAMWDKLFDEVKDCPR